ncbi:MAG TPA: hypothetical protein VNW92_08160 [Polyangiaceae bacterium]|nr:hypothetical protein [Polyangiaceae bacterium]
MSESSSAESVNPFVSGLGKGREAFHAEVTEFALRSGERTPEDFLRHFSCRAIMRSLEARPMERARIVSQSTGVHEKVAHKMSPDASGEALQIALDEGVTTSTAIVRLFQPDDKQRYLERHALWAFDIEGQPWKTTPAVKAAHDRAKSFVAYIMERALENLLVSHEEVVEAITVTKLAQCLPKDKLGVIIQAALKTSDKFTEEDLLGAVPPQALVEHVALDYLWERVVTPLIAEAHDYVPKPIVLNAPKPFVASTSTSSSSDDSDWERRSLNPPLGSAADTLDNGPVSSPTVSDDEIVSEDEILDSEMDDESMGKVAAEGTKGKRN